MTSRTGRPMPASLRTVSWILLGVALGFMLLAAEPSAHALPEYVTRTGEPCATCHVSPAGGGARTVRGNLWIAAGRPDVVPPLPETGASDSEPATPAPVSAKAPDAEEPEAVSSPALPPVQAICGAGQDATATAPACGRN